VVFGLAALVACNDKDTDEQQTSVSKAVAGQQAAAQKPAEKPEADEGEEGEEGPATPAAVAAEKPAPQQTSGKQFAYNFDSDTPGQLPAGAAYILPRRSLVDLPTVLIGLIALAVLMLTKKIPEPVFILAAGAVGVLLHGTAG
jgi:hypothetical protein